LSALQAHRTTLLESPEYQLMCKHLEAEENGIDLIAQVIGTRQAQTHRLPADKAPETLSTPNAQLEKD